MLARARSSRTLNAGRLSVHEQVQLLLRLHDLCSSRAGDFIDDGSPQAHRMDSDLAACIPTQRGPLLDEGHVAAQPSRGRCRAAANR